MPDARSAPTKERALAVYEHLLGSWEQKYPKGVECLRQDKEELFAFYEFPAELWVHVRTTTPSSRPTRR